MKKTIIKNRIQYPALILLFGIVFFCTHPTLAQEARFQKFGVSLDSWAESQLLFWKRVYSEYSSSDQIVHDSVNLTHVYGVESDPIRAREVLSQTRDSLKEIAKLGPSPITRERLRPDLNKLFAVMEGIEDARAYGFAASHERIRIQSGLKDKLETAFLYSKKYLPRMREIFDEEQVPRELALLPFVESAFDVEARSKVGATGIWQFMPETAMRDLRVSTSIDERHDPLKSTRAAARYLRRNHDELGSWALAIMAYHHGPGLVKKAIRKMGTRNPVSIIRTFKDPRFRFASRNYLFEFLAICDVEMSRDTHLKASPNESLPEFITVSFQKRIHLPELLQRYRLNESEIRALNPHFREPIWKSKDPVPAHYPVRLAGITLEEFRRLEYRNQ